MSALQELGAEWHNASPGGKALMITAVIAVAGLGLYTAHIKKSSATSGTSGGTLIPIGDSGDSGSIDNPTPSGGSTTGGSTTGGTITPTKPPSPTPKPAPKPVPKPSPKPAPKPVTQKYVTVQKWIQGFSNPNEMSSLSAIAKKYYGDASKWTLIYNANKNQIKNPNLIYAGQRLVLPGI